MGIIARKYNFYTENVLVSATNLSSDYVYTGNIKGQIARISKQDICRHLVKSKEKLKTKQVQKVCGVEDSSPTLASEAYLYSDKEVAITQLGVLNSDNEDTLVYCMRNRNYL